jgi:hypothetical protein
MNVPFEVPRILPRGCGWRGAIGCAAPQSEAFLPGSHGLGHELAKVSRSRIRLCSFVPDHRGRQARQGKHSGHLFHRQQTHGKLGDSLGECGHGVGLCRNDVRQLKELGGFGQWMRDRLFPLFMPLVARQLERDYMGAP